MTEDFKTQQTVEEEVVEGVEEQEHITDARAVFEEFKQQYADQSTEVPPTPSGEGEEEKKQKREKKKRQYISRADRVNTTLMKMLLKELKYIHENSFQPDVKAAAERAAVLVKTIVEFNEDLFPNVLKK